MGQKELNRWVCEENLVRFEAGLNLATNEKDRDRLRAMLDREREHLRLLPPKD